MTTNLLAIRTARERVLSYQRESEALAGDPSRADSPGDCESLLQLGIEAYRWLLLADQVMRGAAYETHAEPDAETMQLLDELCADWLTPLPAVEQCIETQRQRGDSLTNLKAFRECAVEMQALARASGATEHFLPDGLVALRDAAIHEHRRGETLEIFPGEE